MHIEDHIPYSQKIWPGIKFGSLAVCLATAKTAKFKSANIFTMVIWGPTAKFNSRQYFRLYGNPKIFNLFPFQARELDQFKQYWNIMQGNYLSNDYKQHGRNKRILTNRAGSC